MILARLVDADQYADTHPGLAAGFEFLRTADIGQLADGRHEIDGDRIFAMIARGTGRGQDASPLEYHQRYLDIQFVCEGSDLIGWLPTDACRNVRSEYDAASDLGFFSDRPTTWLAVPAGSFAVFFPEDAHAPLADNHPFHKVVIKVAVDRAVWH